MEEGGIRGSPIIRQISKSVVHRVCAGQVILDLSSAVKELVENSLDAGATSVEIALKDYGEELFQVIDNGTGITPENFKVLALRHHTSKLVNFSDLQFLTTFGFRGEALSSICALGDLTVETRTEHEQVATYLTYDRSGLLIGERKTARQVGTTVTVSKLFSSLPVRNKEFKRNIRKEYGKLVSLLHAYAVISKGVRLVCTNTIGKGTKSVVIKTQGSDLLKDNVITLLGMGTFNCLDPVSLDISGECKVEGFLSKPGQGSGRNLGDRQYYFVNGRPVDMPKVSKIVNELYKGANSKQYPIAILNFTISMGACDVNLTPDKRKVFLSEENSIMLSLREGLQKLYSSANASYSVNSLSGKEKVKESSISIFASQDEVTALSQKNYSFDTDDGGKACLNDISCLAKNETLSGMNPSTIDDCDPISCSPMAATMPKHSNGKNSCHVQPVISNFVTINKRKHPPDDERPVSELPILRNHATLRQLKQHRAEQHNNEEMTNENRKNQNDNTQAGDTEQSTILGREIAFQSNSGNLFQGCGLVHGEVPDGDPGRTEKLTLDDGENMSSQEKGLDKFSKDALLASPSLQSGVTLMDSSLPSSEKRSSTYKFHFEEFRSRRLERLLRLKNCSSGGKKPSQKNYVAATIEVSQPDDKEKKSRVLAAAATELERFFEKEDFNRMKVIGQFNLGFIVGKLDNDLFIVDQHAADEKYNFERLCESTILNQQPLLRPITLELFPEEEIVASLNIDIIRKNGFSLEEDMEAPPGRRFKLKAVPFSKNITFGVDDIKDLISTLADDQGDCSVMASYRKDTHDSVCPSRVRAMLASRACRSSVMIGDALGQNEMQKILRHLAGLNSPWNCPHGRPTMRHLLDLTTLYKRNEDDAESL